MLENLAHEVLVHLRGSNESVHVGRIVQRLQSGHHVGVAAGRIKPVRVEEVFPVDDHLGPAVHRNRRVAVLDGGHVQCARRECRHAQIFHDFRRRVGIEDARFGPRQRVLQRMVNHVRQVSGGERGSRPRSEIRFGNRNDLDRGSCFRFELRGHRLLLRKPVGLLFGRPES